MIINDFGDDRKTQADACFLGANERVEDLLAKIFGDARAGIGDFYGDAEEAVTRLRRHADFEFRRNGGKWIRRTIRRGGAIFLSARTHGFAGVENQIDEDLLE